MRPVCQGRNRRHKWLIFTAKTLILSEEKSNAGLGFLKAFPVPGYKGVAGCSARWREPGTEKEGTHTEGPRFLITTDVRV
jgi:hypothetical protein